MVLVAVTGTTKVARTDRMGPDGCISARYLAPKRTQYQPVPGDIRGAHWTCWSKSPVDTQEMWRFHVKWNHNRFIRNAGGMLNVDPNLHDVSTICPDSEVKLCPATFSLWTGRIYWNPIQQPTIISPRWSFESMN